MRTISCSSLRCSTSTLRRRRPKKTKNRNREAVDAAGAVEGVAKRDVVVGQKSLRTHVEKGQTARWMRRASECSSARSNELSLWSRRRRWSTKRRQEHVGQYARRPKSLD